MKSTYDLAIYELLTLHSSRVDLPSYHYYEVDRNGDLDYKYDAALIYRNLSVISLKLVKRIECMQHYKKKFPITERLGYED